MQPATAPHPRIRILRAAAWAVGATALAAAATTAWPAAALAAQKGGGRAYYAPPVISGLACSTGCPGDGAQIRDAEGGVEAKTSSHRVDVREGGRLVVRGRNLGATHRVIFLGSRKPGDEARARPRSVKERRISVKVPRRARTGRIVLLDSYGRKSRPSRPWVKVLPLPKPYIWPVKGTITSPFGENRGDHMHAGLDIASPSGTPIQAAAAGLVIQRGWMGAYGNFVCVAHERLSQSTCYAHLSSYSVKKGDRVTQGQRVGRVGCTGRCTGDHVHFEVRRGTEMWGTPLNPIPLLP